MSLAKGPDCSELTLRSWLVLTTTTPTVADLLIALAVVLAVVLAVSGTVRIANWAFTTTN